MASTFKRLNSDDVTTTRSPLYESITLTTPIIQQTGDVNVKKTIGQAVYANNMFQSVYDGVYTLASSNPLFDVSFGVSAESSGTVALGYLSVAEPDKRVNTYNGISQIIQGFDSSGAVKSFIDKTTNNTKYHNLVFLSLSRLIGKDEVRRGTFKLKFDVADSGSTSSLLEITDADSTNNYYIDSPTGDYGVLKVTTTTANSDKEVGFIFYQAGVVAVSTSIFAKYDNTKTELVSIKENKKGHLSSATLFATNTYISDLFTKGSFTVLADTVRARISYLEFQNTTEINSAIYFCRANHNEFNYSSNPTYIKDSKIVVKNSSFDSPVSYITTVGLYSVDEELLAVAKLSEPIKKTPDDSILLRVRLDV